MISGAQQLLVALHFATLESPSEWDHFDRSLYCELPDCVCVILYPYSFMVSWIQVKILLRTGPSRCRLPFPAFSFSLLASLSLAYARARACTKAVSVPLWRPWQKGLPSECLLALAVFLPSAF